MSEGLHIVDLQGRPTDDQAQTLIARSLDAALGDLGFCYLTNTAVPSAVVDDAFAASRQFHALPQAAKDELAINKFHRGYIAPASSVIRTSSVETVTRPNLSDSLMVMHDVPTNSADFGRPLNGPNQWPALPGFQDTTLRYMHELRALCVYVTGLVCRALGLPASQLDAHFEQPTEWLRFLRYPPLPPGASPSEFSGAPHTDYGFITVLAQDGLGGLEVRDRQGVWQAAEPMEGAFILNVADMLERWTDGRWPSSAHRVRNIANVDRYALPYFYDPHIDTEVRPLPSVDKRTARGPVIFGDYVLERLNRNYSYRQAEGDR